MISERDVAFYREQGYLVVPDVLEPETLGVLRRDLAVILEGVHYRYLHGQTVGTGFEQVGELVEPLLEAGLDSLRERR